MTGLEQFRTECGKRFAEFMGELDSDARLVNLCRSDVDGLAAGVLVARGLHRLGFTSIQTRATGKGENPWSPSLQQFLRHQRPDAIIVSDLGTRVQRIFDGQTLIIDHHRPTGTPEGATLLSGYGLQPTPTSGLIAFWCVSSLTDMKQLSWLAALSVLADMGESSLVTGLAIPKNNAAMKNAVSLLNAARRSATGDAAPALKLLLEANSIADLLLDSPERQLLCDAQREVQSELAKAKKSAPKFSRDVALISMNSPCQVHPVVAQIWRSRLPKYIVIAANYGFRSGFVHFSARTAIPRNLVDFLRDNAPAGADEGYGSGHDQASGGALTYEAWNDFVQKLGFGDETRVNVAEAA